MIQNVVTSMNIPLSDKTTILMQNLIYFKIKMVQRTWQVIYPSDTNTFHTKAQIRKH